MEFGRHYLYQALQILISAWALMKKLKSPFQSPIALMRQKMPAQYKQLKQLKLKLTAAGVFTNEWMMDQQIPMQSLNRTLFEYDITFFGDHQIYSPKLSSDNPCSNLRNLRFHYTPQAIPQPYYYHVENAGVSLPHIVDPIRPNRVIMETLPYQKPIMEGRHWPLNPSGRRHVFKYATENEIDFEEAYIFSTYWWRNYYHFIVDTCALYFQLRECGAITSDTQILSLGLPTSWQREYLEILGIDPDTFIDIGHRCVKVRRLLIGSPTRHRFVVSKTAIENLKQSILESIAPIHKKPFKKIFVSRRLADHRRILNEEEVSSFLGTRGFVTVEAEKLTIREQIELFSEAKTIVAPHGAGLTNMVYSEKPKIIELFAEDAFDRGYFVTLANVLDGKHTPLVFKAQNTLNDFYVDIDSLKPWL